MTRDHLLALLLAGYAIFSIALGSPQPVRAQENIPPTIMLGGSQPAASAQSPPPSGTPGASQSAFGPASEDSPMIRLQPHAIATPDTPLAPQVERDRAMDVLPTGEEWLLPLIVPFDRLPREVRIGESLPAPGILRLTGETAQTRLTLELPDDVITPTDLRLALRSGVDVLTEAATLHASINGAEPVEVPLRSIADFTTASLPAPALTAGNNIVVLTVHQPHRIFCGPEASFDVWTEIDLANSGAAVPADALRPDAEGFAYAMNAQLARSGSLDLLVDDAIEPSLLRKASDAVMHGLSGRGLLQVTSFYGTDAPLFAAVALIASDRSALSYRRGATGAIVLQVEYHGDRLPDLTGALTSPPSGEAPLGRITPGQPIPLSGLGVTDIVGNTHYFRRDVEFLLPDDWLLLANQKARLTLRYGFARSLAEGAILLVKVNDQTVRLLPLDRSGGKMQPPLPIAFNANILNPGHNTLSFEMMVPGAPSNEACPIRTTDMLAVLAESTLDVPPSPAMMLPGMAAPFAGLMPSRITVPEEVASDLDLQAEAIRLASGLANPLTPRPDVSLTLARLGELNVVPLDGAGVTQGQVQSLLFAQRARIAETKTDAPPATTQPAFTLDTPDVDSPTVMDRRGLLGRIGARIADELGYEGKLRRDARRFRQTAFQGSQQSLQEWMANRAGQALLWRPDPTQPDALWLIIGPQVPIDEVTDRLAPLIADRSANGEAAVLRSDGTWDIWTPIRPPVLRERLLGPGLRTILGNYASWSPLLFTLALLVLALVSALPALFYVFATRGQKGRP